MQLSTIWRSGTAFLTMQRQASGSACDIAALLVLQQSCEHPEQEWRGLNLGPVARGGLDISASRKKLLAIFKMHLHPHIALNYLTNYSCMLQLRLRPPQHHGRCQSCPTPGAGCVRLGKEGLAAGIGAEWGRRRGLESQGGGDHGKRRARGTQGSWGSGVWTGWRNMDGHVAPAHPAVPAAGPWQCPTSLCPPESLCGLHGCHPEPDGQGPLQLLHQGVPLPARADGECYPTRETWALHHWHLPVSPSHVSAGASHWSQCPACTQHWCRLPWTPAQPTSPLHGGEALTVGW